MIASRSAARWQQLDPLIVLAAAALTTYGVVLVASATWQYVDQPGLLTNVWFLKQLGFAIVGLIGMGACAALDPRVLSAFSYPVYGLSLLSLVAVLLLGHGAEEYGAQRWIEVAGIAIQPSEVVKVTLAIALAKVFTTFPPGLRALGWSALITAPAMGLVYLQPDLGTALSLGAIWFGMVVLAGTPRRYLVAMVALAVFSAPLVWVRLQEYMRARIIIYLDPKSDPLGQGYNILQAQISIGSGGMFGKGLLEGTQTQLRYLRVSHSDFIFSVLGEELGFVGAVVLFVLLALLLFRIFRAYEVATDRFAALLCAGVGAMIGFQALANLGANVGLTPVVGIPLPFVSYGGSALVAHLAALGFVEGALLRRRRYRFEI